MKNWIATLVFVAVLTTLGSAVFAQSGKGAFGIGFNAGAMKIYGDRPEESFGVGGEGTFSYRLLPFADIGLAVGYGQLKYNFVPGTNGTTTDLINVDLKSNWELLSRGVFRPYITLGGGIISYNIRGSAFGRSIDPTAFGGGGFRVQFNPTWNWYVGADYRFTKTDRLDNNRDEGSADDGFLNFRSGITYQWGGRGDRTSDIIADARAPIYEVDDTGFFDAPSGYSETETKNMEEYVKLKSRVDQITSSVDSRDREILDLQRTLSERKRMLASLENQVASKAGRVRIPRNASMSGFSEIYEQALTHYYNKSFGEGISLFRMLLQQYSNHALASNCQFWIAQSFFSMNRYQEAIDAYFTVLDFERSLKKDDALFFLGKSYLKMGSGDRARQSFGRLMQDYPASEYRQQAQGYLAKL